MRYYLRIRDGQTLIEEPDGESFSSLDAARREAILAAREILAGRLAAGQPFGRQVFEIKDSQGNIVATVPFLEAIPPG